MSMRGVNRFLIIYKFCRKSKPTREVVHDFIMHRDYEKYSDSIYFVQTIESIDQFLGDIRNWVSYAKTFDEKKDEITVIDLDTEDIRYLCFDDEDEFIWEPGQMDLKTGADQRANARRRPMYMTNANRFLVTYKFCKKSKSAREVVHDFIMHRDYKKYSDSTYFVQTRESIDEFLGGIRGCVSCAKTFDEKKDKITVIELDTNDVRYLYFDDEDGFMWELGYL